MQMAITWHAVCGNSHLPVWISFILVTGNIKEQATNKCPKNCTNFFYKFGALYNSYHSPCVIHLSRSRYASEHTMFATLLVLHIFGAFSNILLTGNNAPQIFLLCLNINPLHNVPPQMLRRLLHSLCLFFCGFKNKLFIMWPYGVKWMGFILAVTLTLCNLS